MAPERIITLLHEIAHRELEGVAREDTIGINQQSEIAA